MCVSYDPFIKHATVYFITPSNKLLLVQLSYDDNKWTTPGGALNFPNEHPYIAALREFKEETGFYLNENYITSFRSIALQHDNGNKTVFYIVRSNQHFGIYDREQTDGETINMKFIDLMKLKRELFSHKYVSYFSKFTKKLFDRGFL